VNYDQAVHDRQTMIVQTMIVQNMIVQNMINELKAGRA